MQHFIIQTAVQQLFTTQTLRDYQQEAVDRVLGTSVGQVILPTGSGKSVIQASIIETRIKNKNGAGIYVILTPRILLTNQLMKNTIRHLALDAGITNVRAVTVHSGDPATLFDEKDSEESLETLKGVGITLCQGWNELHEEIVKTFKKNESLVVCCTYQSVETLIAAMDRLESVKIDQVLCDEAHYVTQRTNFDNIIRLKKHSDATHFFTATRCTSKANKWTGKGLGMDNKSVYGDIICTRSIAELAAFNYIVAPKLHVTTTTSHDHAQTTIECFDYHSLAINVEAGNGKNVNAKMLVCCDGTKTLEQIRNDQKLIDYARKNDIAVFAISSKCGAWKNGDQYESKYDSETRKNVSARDQFLADLLDHEGKAIVLHIAILTEGIDVPNMTGVLFFRDMTISRFSQSIGRAMRAVKSDFGLDWEDRIKKFAHIIVPVVSTDPEDQDKYGNVQTMVGLMRQSGMPVDDPIIGGYDVGVEVKPRLENTNETKRRIRDIIDDENAEWTHDIESDEEARLVFEMLDTLNDPDASDEDIMKAIMG